MELLVFIGSLIAIGLLAELLARRTTYGLMRLLKIKPRGEVHGKYFNEDGSKRPWIGGLFRTIDGAVASILVFLIPIAAFIFLT